MNKIVNGKTIKMSAEEEKYYSAMPEQEPSIEERLQTVESKITEYLGMSSRIESLEIENKDLIKKVKALEKDVSDLQLSSGGSVKPDIPFDPAPKPGGGFKPKPGGGLTIGG